MGEPIVVTALAAACEVAVQAYVRLLKSTCSTATPAGAVTTVPKRAPRR